MTTCFRSRRAAALALTLALLAFAGCRSLPATHGARPALAQQAAVRQAFIDALQRIRLRLPEPPDSAALQAYPLHAYLVAARLQRDLQRQPSSQLDSRIDAFLRTHAGQPVTHDLQHAWLTSLADRQRWDWFLPRALHVSDPQLVCERLAGRLATGDTAGLAAAVLERWSAPLQQPPACNTVFDWLRQRGALTSALAQDRVRAALAAGDARLAQADLSGVATAQAAPLLQWAQLLQTPRAALSALAADPAMAVEPQALAAGFARLSLRDSAAAAALLPQLLARPDMTPALHMQLQRDAALGLAYDHDPLATAAFVGLPAPMLDPQVQQWRVRAALWIGDYRQALDWIDQMPDALGAQPRWRYWRARAIDAIEGPTVAAPLYAEIAGLRDYYGYLAADRLQRGYDLNARPTLDDTAAQSALAAEPGLIRAHELFACGLYDDAVAEWATALRGATAALRVQAAHLATRWGWYAQSIESLAQADEWDDVRLRYPRPYGEAIAAAARLTRLPADWILAVMRQESLFRPDAVSSADARGLMQLQPPTAAAVALRWHLPSPAPDALFDPSAAVPLGAARLRELLDGHGGQLALALAAYNAGTAPVARWLPPHPMDADIWIENIPYNETRGYVEHILEHIVAYVWTRQAEPPQLAALLPPVQPAAQTGGGADATGAAGAGASAASSIKLHGKPMTTSGG
ncbi:MAG TPA: transglycosylase SLT domain-containing protein [Steroidobacteraceae bacterium]|jgi:soluble lytic murein transglycosylase|nr:transglycosylase SLT domain-containing protein [Steroidobacteraceae bacterium]